MIGLVQELAAVGFPVVVACRVLKVPTSTYYEAINRQPSVRAVADAALIESIFEIHADSRGTYGAPRVHAELRLGIGIRVGRKRVAHLMRKAQLHGVAHQRKYRGGRLPATHQDLVHRPHPTPSPRRLGLLLRRHRRLIPSGRGLVDR